MDGDGPRGRQKRQGTRHYKRSGKTRDACSPDSETGKTKRKAVAMAANDDNTDDTETPTRKAKKAKATPRRAEVNEDSESSVDFSRYK